MASLQIEPRLSDTYSFLKTMEGRKHWKNEATHHPKINYFWKYNIITYTEWPSVLPCGSCRLLYMQIDHITGYVICSAVQNFFISWLLHVQWALLLHWETVLCGFFFLFAFRGGGIFKILSIFNSLWFLFFLWQLDSRFKSLVQMKNDFEHFHL